MTWLAALFALTAALYASVGFGGGSTYAALLLLAGTDFTILPVIALVCNVIVVTGGSVRYAMAGQVPWRRLWLILLFSVPLAFVGGRLPVAQGTFTLLLGLSLLLAGLLLVFQRTGREGHRESRMGWETASLVGGGIGLLSGMVGIGGGIFLAPVLHLSRWDVPHRIAASASVFILVNSLAGIIGQLSKAGRSLWPEIGNFWPLMVAVLIGGLLGNHAGLRIFKPRTIRVATAILILYVALRLLWQAASV